MTRINRRDFVTGTSAGLLLAGSTLTGCAHGTDKFVCPPCGCGLDDYSFDEPGICPDCGMTLAPARERQLGLLPAQLGTGAGRFQIDGGMGREQSRITVHYYRPRSHDSERPILLVIPGAGRNSDDYRNDWLATAERHGVLVAALGYPEEDYDFAAYHLGGIARSVTRENARVERRGKATVIHMQDEDIRVAIERDERKWLFNDFDRVFEFIRGRTAGRQATYAMFGHSAGGQILHRKALFYPASGAHHVVAANSGFYTLPATAMPFPMGLQGTPVDGPRLKRALAGRLTLLLGELDNDDTAGGTLLHTPLIDQQGLGRRDRGISFYKSGRAAATQLQSDFSWQLKVVPGVGHDHQKMAAAASKILF